MFFNFSKFPLCGGKLPVACLCLCACLLRADSFAQSSKEEKLRIAQSSQWKQFIEEDFPFFSASISAAGVMVDGSEAGGESEQYITPRTLIFPLGMGTYVAYDLDHLCVAAVWTADDSPFVNASLVVNSYPYELNKVPPGTAKLPRTSGEIWIRNRKTIGVCRDTARFPETKRTLPAKQQITQGGLDPTIGRFVGIDVDDACIEYEVGKVHVREQFRRDERGFVRHLRIAPHRSSMFVMLAEAPRGMRFAAEGGFIENYNKDVICRIAPSNKVQEASIYMSPDRKYIDGDDALGSEPRAPKPQQRWRDVVRIDLQPEMEQGVMSVEAIPLPIKNPYDRAVRPADLDFFPDGKAAVVTIDGDVWLCSGLVPGATSVGWRRFASGLHEPLSIRIRNEEIFVFDRNGLWRLLDEDNDGEADYHELFCSRVDQTAETREFPLSLELARDGSFLVSKPGQEGVFSGVVRISPDGRNASLLATGFRQPYLGYDPVTDQLVATDQQGNWVPSTPVHSIENGGFYGFRRSESLDDLPVTQPLTWIPHAECGSATTVVWTREANLGALNDRPLLLSYNPPRLFQLHIDRDGKAAQGGATGVDLRIGSRPILKARMNPADGLLYMAGFKIWGTSADEVTFLGRLRVNEDRTSTVPEVVQVEGRGILLQFEQEMNPKSALRRESYSVRRWNYKRTAAYGSGNYRLDGKPGTEVLGVSSVILSEDCKSVFLGIQDMQPAMQIEVGYELEAKDSTRFRRLTFLTAHALRKIDLTSRGFATNEVDLSTSPLTPIVVEKTAPSIERGAQLYSRVGCVACHSVDGSTDGKNGPSWLALFGSDRRLESNGEIVTADEDYLRESILNPNAKIAVGAINGEAGMPVYEGVLRDDQVESLVLFIKALKDKQASEKLLKDANVRGERSWVIDDFKEDLRSISGRSYSQGKTAFLGASCFSCHQIGEGKGGVLGPDLSKLSTPMKARDLLMHILEPSLRVEDKYKSRTVLTSDGEIYSGFVVFEDESEIRLSKDPLSNSEPVVIEKSEIEQEKLANLSPMPTGTLNSLDRSQVLDLLAYILSKGKLDHEVFSR